MPWIVISDLMFRDMLDTYALELVLCFWTRVEVAVLSHVCRCQRKVGSVDTASRIGSTWNL